MEHLWNPANRETLIDNGNSCKLSKMPRVQKSHRYVLNYKCNCTEACCQECYYIKEIEIFTYKQKYKHPAKLTLLTCDILFKNIFVMY